MVGIQHVLDWALGQALDFHVDDLDITIENTRSFRPLEDQLERPGKVIDLFLRQASSATADP
jgi:hypothetical protein